MAFDGSEGEIVTLSEASGWTRNYRNNAGTGAVLGQFYGKEKLMEILNQSGCVGIRIYKALDDNGTPIHVLVGADADANDMTEIILERGVKCPPMCGASNDLNS